MKPSIPLPIRVAHPPRPQLEHLNDDYFALLKRCGYEALYLQDSPFDSFTGNHGPFRKMFHLISLYDLSNSPEREKYRDYIREACRRTARHDLKTYLCCWEPRLPYSAWGDTPPAWRGHGGYPYAGNDKTISFCWSVPEAVAYWKQMARDTFAALPDIAGVHLGVVDNEANFCDTDCPRCQGRTMARQLEDIYQTFAEVKAARQGDFRIAIYDWWLPAELLERLPSIVGHDALVIGRSSQGHTQPPLPGDVEDMTAVFSGCGPGILAQKSRVDRLGLRLVDMPAWSHPNEAFWLPAPPDPQYAFEKLNALRSLGAVGWYDFDCGSTEPGTIADAIALWTQHPDETVEALVTTLLREIYGNDWQQASLAYEAYRAAKQHIPISYRDPVLSGFSGRMPSLCNTLFGPFRLRDFRFVDTGHNFNWAAPYNFVIESVLPVALPRIALVAEQMQRAYDLIAAVPGNAPRADWERSTFEIYARQYRAMRNYLRLGQVKLDRILGRCAPAAFAEAVREIALDESENLRGLEAWMTRHPNGIYNPCHNLHGWMEEIWPDERFQPDVLAPKRQSLAELLGIAE